MSRKPFLPGVPFQHIDWQSLPQTTHPGEAGVATMRAVEFGSLRARMVEYSPGYVSDHYCDLGHAVLVVEGEIELDMRGANPARVAAGASFVVGTEAAPHRVMSETGAKLFVLD